MRVWNEALRYRIADRAKCVETFGDGPWKALFLCFVLQVAGRQVDGEGVGCAWLSIPRATRFLGLAGDS